MLLRIRHTTRYRYSEPAHSSHNEARLMPATDEEQTCHRFHMAVRPFASVHSYQEPGGLVHFFDVGAPHQELDVTVEAVVETRDRNPFESLNLVTEDREFYALPQVLNDYAEFLMPTQYVQPHPEVDGMAETASQEGPAGAAAFLIALTGLLFRTLTYETGVTNACTTVEQFIHEGRGVCQDFTHLMLAACRSQGIPSRYVSGYLYTGGVEGDNLRGGGATHAWVECLLPDARWHGFDPTNGLVVNNSYVKAHWGLDYGGVVPVRGIYRGGGVEQMDVEVRVELDSASSVWSGSPVEGDDGESPGGAPERLLPLILDGQ